MDLSSVAISTVIVAMASAATANFVAFITRVRARMHVPVPSEVRNTPAPLDRVGLECSCRLWGPRFS